MRKFLTVLISLCFILITLAALGNEILNVLEDIQIKERTDSTFIKLSFRYPIKRQNYRVHYSNNILSIDLKQIGVQAKIANFKGNNAIKKLSISQKSPDKVVILLELNELCQKLFKENRIQIAQRERDLSLMIKHASIVSNIKEQETVVDVPVIVDVPEGKDIVKNKDVVDEALDKYVSPISKLKTTEININNNSKALPVSPLSSFIKSMSALFFILGLILICSWGFKKIAKRSVKNVYGQMVKVVALHHLSPRQMIAVVDVAGERLILGITPAQITTLAKLEISDSHQKIKDFTVNFEEQTLRTQDNISQVLGILKQKMGELKRI